MFLIIILIFRLPLIGKPVERCNCKTEAVFTVNKLGNFFVTRALEFHTYLLWHFMTYNAMWKTLLLEKFHYKFGAPKRLTVFGASNFQILSRAEQEP
jgi:hypothetical protein